MFKGALLILTSPLLIGNLVFGVIIDSECLSTFGTRSSLNLSVHSKRDEKGDWVTSFSACKDYDNSSKSINLDVKQKIIERDGRQLLHIHGVVKDSSTEVEKLRFFQKGGKFAVITNDRMTAFRENAENQKDFASIFTNRPLNNNELFEVRIDKTITNFPGFPMGIGVTSHSPNDLLSVGWMGETRNGTWMLYDKSFIHNGKYLNDNYGRGYQNLKQGDVVGVMRTDTGTLHFFLNGVDEGLAAANIPYPVYGSVDLVRNIAQTTIIDKSPNC